eukprot:g10662.t1
MTALIADTSPILRNIPSDPPGDHRSSFEFSPSPMPARYLPEGNHSQPRDHRHPSPSPRGFGAREVPTLYPQPHHYGYTIAGAFAHHSGMAVNSCAAPTASKTAQQQLQQVSSSEPPSSMWRNNDSSSSSSSSSNNSNNNNLASNARPDAFHADASARSMNPAPKAVSVSAPSRSPSPSAVLAHHRDHPAVPAIELTSSPAKKSDWENLLGAVDLELRAQERAELVPDSTTATATLNI